MVALVGCAGAPGPKASEAHARPLAPPPPSVTYAAGTQALEQNDPVAAARIFAAIGERDPNYAAAQKALANVQPEVASITQAWLKLVDRNIKQERYIPAKKRLEHMLDYFTLDDTARSVIEERLQAVDQGAAVAYANLEETDKQVPALAASGDLAAALKAMRKAVHLARDVAPDTVLERERRIAAVEQRLGPVAFAKPVETVATAPPKRSRRGKKEPSTPAPTPATAVAATPAAGAAAPVAAAPTEEIEPTPAEGASRVRELLDEAQAFQENKAYFNAIVGFLRVRELDRNNDQAVAALTQLEPKRQELVQQYLENANRHFQQQDLASAVPWFRRVLLLEPENEQAKKGLEMHYNLEKIRRERNRK